MKDNKDFSTSNTRCMSDDVRLLMQSLLKARKEFLATGKSARNEHQKYTYAKLGDIYNAVEQALSTNDIVLCHFTDYLQDELEILRTRLIHAVSGQWIEDARVIISEKPGNQAKGAAHTYMKKYAVLSLCAISAEDDDSQAEEVYIARRASEPNINPEQVASLKEQIKNAANKNVLYSNILKFNKIGDLNELKASSFNAVTTYILSNKEA